MCGIVGAMRHRGALRRVLAGLHTLEYRGYDSAGVAWISNNRFNIHKQPGRLEKLLDDLQNVTENPHIVFGHTRWATHGPATQVNAHPHMGAAAALVHNGIIENFAELKEQLQARGHRFLSDTDSEVVAALIDAELAKVNAENNASQDHNNSKSTLSQSMSQLASRHLEALGRAIRRLRGSYALLIQFHDEPQALYAAARHSPLVLGMEVPQQMGVSAQNTFTLASDRLALAGSAEWVIQIGDGQLVRLEGIFDSDQPDVEECKSAAQDSCNGKNNSENDSGASDCGICRYDAYDLFLAPQSLPMPTPLNIDSSETSRGEYQHYMAKEIAEQPRVILQTIASVRDQLKSPQVSSFIAATRNLDQDYEYCDSVEEQNGSSSSQGKNSYHMKQQEQVAPSQNNTFTVHHTHHSNPHIRITLCACGTSYHACSLARDFLERRCGITTSVELASEFAGRGFVDGSSAFIFVSQSGETRDTLAALELARAAKRPTAAVVNVAASQLALRSGAVVLTRAGPEIGVASTKAFTCQLVALLILASAISSGTQPNLLSEICDELEEAVNSLETFLSNKTSMASLKQLASALSTYPSALYVGRGPAWPLALEGALKLKEIAYVHAEGYASGELKHGPLALVDSAMPVVIVVSRICIEKTMAAVQEIAARGGRCIVIIAEDLVQRFAGRAGSGCGSTLGSCLQSQLQSKAGSKAGSHGGSHLTSPGVPRGETPTGPHKVNSTDGTSAASLDAIQLFAIPASGPWAEALGISAALQLLAYHVACARGLDVDKPRNLAKCVTVE